MTGTKTEKIIQLTKEDWIECLNSEEEFILKQCERFNQGLPTDHNTIVQGCLDFAKKLMIARKTIKLLNGNRKER